MRKLSEFTKQDVAERLVDQLLIAEIDSQLRSSGPWEVWVLDDRDMDKARRALESFDPEAKPELTRAAEQIRERKRRDNEQASRRRVDVGERWRGDGSARGLGPVTIFLMIGSVLAAWFGDFEQPGANGTVQLLSIEPWDSLEFLGRVRAGEVWRLLTPMFVHFSFIHILFNMLWLHQLGSEIERQHGSLVMIGLVLISQIPGGLVQYLVSGPSFGGMSGVVYGLFGFVWMQVRYNRRYRYKLDDRTAVMMMIWFVVCVTGLVGPIANIGHAGGLIAGLLAGMPAYVGHLRAHVEKAEFAGHGWAATQLTGRQRVLRRWFLPYMPLWLLLLAAATIAWEWLG
jgi:GlpG protein